MVYYFVKVLVAGVKWEVKRRYKEFDELYTSLQEAHLSLPKMPAKTIGYLVQDSDILLRQEGLDLFLKECLESFDLINDEVFLKFIEVCE